MNANEFRFGFRALGREAERKETVWQSAFRAHVEADPRAMTAGECYLSHFMFPDEFREHLATTGSTAGYTGPTWLQWLVFDIDVADDIDEAALAFEEKTSGNDEELAKLRQLKNVLKSLS